MGVCFSDEAHPFLFWYAAVLLSNYVSSSANRLSDCLPHSDAESGILSSHLMDYVLCRNSVSLCTLKGVVLAVLISQTGRLTF